MAFIHAYKMHEYFPNFTHIHLTGKFYASLPCRGMVMAKNNIYYSMV